MINSRLFRLIHDKRLSVPVLRCFHHEFSQSEPKKSSNENDEKRKDRQMAADHNLQQETKLTGSLSQKYTLFRDEESPQILDIFEERQRYQMQNEPIQVEQVDDTCMDLYLKRGLTGVFDIEDLVDVLRNENAKDIFVCSVPKELKYVDYLVVCSGRSYRHMLAMAEFLRRVYKLRRQKGDILPRIEGEKNHDWMAMDLGNIALHIFSPTARKSYDLESLWSIGIEYDKEFNKPQDPVVEIFEKYSTLLADIKPQK